MWKKSLTNLIGIFGMVLMLSSCARPLHNPDDNSTPSDDSKDSEANITAFSVTDVANTIDVTCEIIGNNIVITVPPDADVSALIPTITVPAKASVSPASGEKQDFTTPVRYTVTAKDLSTKTYIVTVRVVIPTCNQT